MTTLPDHTKKLARRVRDLGEEGGTVVEFVRGAKGPDIEEAVGYPGMVRHRRQDGSWGAWRISRRIRSKRYRFSTGCYRLEAAAVVYVQFESDPDRTLERYACGDGPRRRLKMKPAVRRYLRHLERVKRSRPRTIRNNRTTLERFAASFSTGPHHVTAQGLQDYVVELGELYTATTVRLHWKLIAAFLRWCHRSQWCREPPLAEIVLPPVDQPPRASGRVLLEADDVRRLLEVAPVTPAKAHVRHALVVLWGTGMRVGELWLIRPPHLSRDGRELAIPKSKARGRWHKRVPITDPVVRESVAWLAEWNAGVRRSARYAEDVLREELERMAAEAGVERFSPKSVRMSAMNRWLSEGCAESDIARWVGHHAVEVFRRFYMHEDRRAVKLPGAAL